MGFQEERSGYQPSCSQKSIDKLQILAILSKRLKEGDSFVGLPEKTLVRFGKIEIPDPLIKAQENNKLVVFAGAGVSFPAGIRGFKTLVEETELAFDKEPIENNRESLERRLGRLEDDGHDVHKLIFDKISSYSNHCDLHLLILKLFRRGQHVRVVTTNFDNLFRSAAKAQGLGDLVLYHAPALPPGHRFKGVVHIHGCVDTDPEDLVLTERDFGRAYLTEGWARRFLVDVFSTYTVLFYGYSVSDIILRYLAGALPIGTERFAFCREGDKRGWEDIRINPIGCTVDDNEDVHAIKEQCLRDWVEWTEAGYLWYDSKIRSIVSLSTSPDPASSDILLSALKSVSNTRLFTRHAIDPEWLSWLDERKALDPLFEQAGKLTDEAQLLCQWIAHRFVIPHCNEVLELIHKHGGSLNHLFWYSILDAIVFNRGQEKRPPADVLATWVAVLLDGAPSNDESSSRLFGYLVAKCEWPQDRYTIVVVLSYLLQPRYVSDMELGFPDPEPSKFENRIRVELVGDDYALNSAWEKHKVHLPGMWRWLLPSVQKYLTDAHETNRRFGAEYDAQSTWRSAIEEHEQDKDAGRAFDVLIDVARDILEYLLNEEDLQGEGMALVDSWYASDIPLLHRLAIHGRAVGECWSADEKIKWLLENDLIYDRVYRYKHEVFHIIESALAESSPDVVKSLVDVVVNKEVVEFEGTPEDRRIRDYERYNLLYWMTQKAPESDQVKSAFDNYCRAHPNFEPREYPDLDVWTSGVQFVPPESPINASQLIDMPLPEVAKLLVEHKGRFEFHDEDDREGLLETLSAAVNTSFIWSMDLAAFLMEGKVLKSDIWEYLIKGWTQSPLSDQDWEKVLGFLSTHRNIHEKTQAACKMLEQAAKRNAEIADDILAKMERLSDIIWEILDPIPDTQDWEGSSWLTKAINHGAGQLCEFWLQALHRRYRKDKDGWEELPEDYKKRFEHVLNSQSYSGGLASCVLASRLHYLNSLDHGWTKDKLLPYFNYETHADRADLAWHGYLMWGEISHNLISELKALVVQAVKHLTDPEKRLRKSLFVKITDLMILDSKDESPDFDWFHKTISPPEAGEEDRQEVVDRVWETLRQASDPFRISIWNQWLKKFWEDRVVGNPVPLAEGESNRLIECTTWLAPVYPEAVELACRTTNHKFEYTHLYADLQDSGLVETHAADIVRLMVHLLKDSGSSTDQGYYLRPLYESLAHRLAEPDYLELKNILVGLGVISAL